MIMKTKMSFVIAEFFPPFTDLLVKISKILPDIILHGLKLRTYKTAHSSFFPTLFIHQLISKFCQFFSISWLHLPWFRQTSSVWHTATAGYLSKNINPILSLCSLKTFTALLRFHCNYLDVLVRHARRFIIWPYPHFQSQLQPYHHHSLPHITKSHVFHPNTLNYPSLFNHVIFMFPCFCSCFLS